MPAGDLRLAGRLVPMTATGDVPRDVFGSDKPTGSSVRIDLLP